MIGYSYEQALHAFATGQAAMWQSGPWSVNAMKEIDPDLAFGMFPIPGPEERTGWLVANRLWRPTEKRSRMCLSAR